VCVCVTLNVLMCRQSADTVKMLSATQQTQEEVERTKRQLSFEVDRIKQEAEMKVGVFSLQEHAGFKVAVLVDINDVVSLSL